MVAYKSYMEEQRFLTAKSSDVKILSRALSGFTSLEGLNIDFWNKHIGVRELEEAFGAVRCDRLLTKDCEYILPAVFRALSRSSAKIKTLGLGYGEGSVDDLDGNPNLAFAGYAPLSSPHFSPRRPEESITDSSCLEGITSITAQAIYRTFTSQDEYGCEYALRGVRKLEIGRISQLSHDRDSLSEMSTGVCQLISFAPLLETITVKEMYSGFGPYPTFFDIFPSHHLRNLRNLDLCNLDTTERVLIEFFTWHTATVVDVCFRSMYVTDTDWSSVLSRLRSLTFPVLESFELDDCFPNINCRAQDYILHRTDKDPSVDQE